VLSIAVFLVAASGAQGATAPQLIAAGHWKRAAIIVEAQCKASPDEPEVNFLLSQIRAAFGDRLAPQTFAERAVALAPAVARYHRQLAEVQGVMAQHANALQQVFLGRKFRKEIDTALALDAQDVQALRDLMEFHLLAPGILGGDLKTADGVAGRIAAIDATEGFLARARVAAFRKDYRLADEMTRKAAGTSPGSYRAEIASAQYHLAPEHRDEAVAEDAARRAMSLDPSRIDAHVVLASVLAGRESFEALDRALESAAQTVPDDATPFYRAAEQLLAKKTGLPRAERYLRRYLQQDPEGNQPSRAEAHWQLGLALEGQGRLEAATDEWKKAVQLDPSSPAVRELRRTRARTH
jgi:tetratricopeptide (TPR) repeat protein